MESNELIVLPGLSADQPVTLTPLQSALVPYSLTLVGLWWALWCVTLLYVAGRYLIFPLMRAWRA